MGWGQPAASGNVVSLDYAACGQFVVCSGAPDHGDIYYVRSTDAGVTWSTVPVKLNSDTGTAIQWQPSLTATREGALFASWYDGREANGGLAPELHGRFVFTAVLSALGAGLIRQRRDLAAR